MGGGEGGREGGRGGGEGGWGGVNRLQLTSALKFIFVHMFFQEALHVWGNVTSA